MANPTSNDHMGVPWVMEFDPSTGAWWPHFKLATQETFLGEVGGLIKSVAVQFAKETGTAAYAVNDTVSNSVSSPSVLTFSNIARTNGGSGYIVKARLMTDQPTCTAQFRLHLYMCPPSAQADNGQFNLAWANDGIRLGYIDFPALFTEGTGSTAATAIVTPGNGNLPLAFNCTGTVSSIYGILETLSVFTPISAQNFYLKLSADLN